jgi:DNA polymerase-4
MRLRSYGCIAGAMRVKIKLRNRDSWENQAVFDPTSDTLKLLEVLESLWRNYPRKGGLQPLAVAVALSRLDEQGHQARSLFDEGRPHDKLNAIIDSLNLRYGRNTLYFGGAHSALQAAPMRIAFGHIPDLTVEGDD